MGDFLARIAEEARRERTPVKRSTLDWYIQNIWNAQSTQFALGGHTYQVSGLRTTWPNQQINIIQESLPGYLEALRSSPPAFAAEMVRALVLSGARFVFRNNFLSATPGRTFANSALTPLERPWPNGTTGELIARMEWSAGLCGNAFVHREPLRVSGEFPRLRVLRPDWVGILYGSQREPEDPGHALDGKILGYLYVNGGWGGRHEPTMLLPEEVAHWSPLPDPESPGMGMSWITPGLRDIQGDRAATEHKLRFFSNGATPNLVVKGLTAGTPEQFLELVDELEERHAGLANAYRTLYLSGGADATVVGSNLQEMDFSATQGKGETRLSLLSRVPASILGISEGLAGSSLNAGNFGMARRIFADTWVYPTLQDLAAALAPLIRVPGDADLWTSTKDIPLLREDARDAAEIAQVQATTISGLVKEGFTPDSAIKAVISQDMAALEHSGLVSVQLQPPGQLALPASPAPLPQGPMPTGSAQPPMSNGKAGG